MDKVTRDAIAPGKIDLDTHCPMQKNYFLQQWVRELGFTINDFTSSSISLTQLKEADLTATQLKKAGYPAAELKTAEFTAAELAEAGFNKTQLVQASISLAELKQAGVTATILKNADFTIVELKDVGYTAAELKTAEFTAADLKAADFTAADLKAAEFTAAECKDAEFTIAELKAADFTAAELKTAEFTAVELKDAKYTPAELKTAEFTAAELKTAKFTAAECKDAEFTAAELAEARYPFSDLKNAGFSTYQARYATEKVSRYAATALCIAVAQTIAEGFSGFCSWVVSAFKPEQKSQEVAEAEVAETEVAEAGTEEKTDLTEYNDFDCASAGVFGSLSSDEEDEGYVDARETAAEEQARAQKAARINLAVTKLLTENLLKYYSTSDLENMEMERDPLTKEEINTAYDIAVNSAVIRLRANHSVGTLSDQGVAEDIREAAATYRNDEMGEMDENVLYTVSMCNLFTPAESTYDAYNNYFNDMRKSLPEAFEKANEYLPEGSPEHAAVEAEATNMLTFGPDSIDNTELGDVEQDENGISHGRI